MDFFSPAVSHQSRGRATPGSIGAPQPRDGPLQAKNSEYFQQHKGTPAAAIAAFSLNKAYKQRRNQDLDLACNKKNFGYSLKTRSIRYEYEPRIRWLGSLSLPYFRDTSQSLSNAAAHGLRMLLAIMPLCQCFHTQTHFLIQLRQCRAAHGKLLSS